MKKRRAYPSAFLDNEVGGEVLDGARRVVDHVIDATLALVIEAVGDTLAQHQQQRHLSHNHRTSLSHALDVAILRTTGDNENDHIS